MKSYSVVFRASPDTVKRADEYLYLRGTSRSEVLRRTMEHIAAGGTLPFEVGQVPAQDQRSVTGKRIAAQEKVCA